MSRSVRKTPVIGITSAVSEKKDKQNANRKFRRVTKQIAKSGGSENFPLVRELSNVWSFDKDGKRYDENLDIKYMRK